MLGLSPGGTLCCQVPESNTGNDGRAFGRHVRVSMDVLFVLRSVCTKRRDNYVLNARRVLNPHLYHDMRPDTPCSFMATSVRPVGLNKINRRRARKNVNVRVKSCCGLDGGCDGLAGSIAPVYDAGTVVGSLEAEREIATFFAIKRYLVDEGGAKVNPADGQASISSYRQSGASACGC